MGTLVIDTGTDIVGIYSVDDGTYHPYRGDDIRLALKLIACADEVVTYNGKHYDLLELGKFAGMSVQFPLKGKHTDMRSICWSDRIFGRDLLTTYRMHFDSCPEFPPTHEGVNNRDVYVTFKLWELWNRGELKVLDAHQV